MNRDLLKIEHAIGRRGHALLERPTADRTDQCAGSPRHPAAPNERPVAGNEARIHHQPKLRKLDFYAVT
jgi:hypothetical protein